MTEPVVRVATVDDLDDVMRLSMQLGDEQAFLPHIAELTLQQVWPALNLDNGICGIIKPEGGEAEGVILLRIGTMWYSYEKTLDEKFVFVPPKFRSAKGGRGRKLCEFAKRCAKELNLPLSIGILSNHRTAGKIKLYERIFGPPAGAFFLYNGHTNTFDNKNVIEE
jgi:hypothetical protein